MEWISVEDRLPELKGGTYASSDIVIVALEGRKQSDVMFYNREPVRGKATERWRDRNLNIYRGKVTHWMPLPEPPPED